MPLGKPILKAKSGFRLKKNLIIVTSKVELINLANKNVHVIFTLSVFILFADFRSEDIEDFRSEDILFADFRSS